MLPYGLFVSFAAILGMTIYRESSPIQPTPKLMSVTLVTLTKFIHPHMYAHLPPYQVRKKRTDGCGCVGRDVETDTGGGGEMDHYRCWRRWM